MTQVSTTGLLNHFYVSYDACLEVGGEIVRTVLFVLCTEVVHSHKHI